MAKTSAPRQWNSVSKLLHWFIAALIFVQLLLGFLAIRQREVFLGSMDMSMFDGVIAAFNWHKSVGLLIGLLMIWRMIWRATHRPPPLSGETSALVKLATQIVHWGLYLAVFTLVGSGFVISEAVAHEIDFFYLFEIPILLSVGETGQALAEQVHFIAMWSLCGLLVLHIGAAFFHHLALKDDTLIKMLPIGGAGKSQNGK